jgi:hypothetical protein
LKKNQKTYVLLAVVLAIWGILGFRILSAVNPKDPLPSTHTAISDFRPTAPKARDTFSILANYRDPFLGTLPKSKIRTSPPKKTTPAPVVKKNINFTGHIRDQKSDQVIFFVNIEGQQHMMSLKDEVDGVRLLKGNEDQITVLYENRRETIHRTP